MVALREPGSGTLGSVSMKQLEIQGSLWDEIDQFDKKQKTKMHDECSAFVKQVVEWLLGGAVTYCQIGPFCLHSEEKNMNKVPHVDH